MLLLCLRTQSKCLSVNLDEHMHDNNMDTLHMPQFMSRIQKYAHNNVL